MTHYPFETGSDRPQLVESASHPTKGGLQPVQPRLLRGVAICAVLVFFASVLTAHEEGFPGETLKKVFPEASGFTTRKAKSLTPAQVKQIAQQSGSKVETNDNPLTFYVALDKAGSGVLGTVLMLDATGSKGDMDLAVGILRDGTVARVLVTENHDDPNLASAAFLDQIRGKSLQSPMKVGQDIHFTGDPKSAQALLNAVRRGMYLIAAAQGTKI